MTEEEKRNQIAKQIVLLNPAIGTSLEVIMLLQKHIETKMLLSESLELIVGTLLIPSTLNQKEGFNLSEEKVLQDLKKALKEKQITPPSLN